MAGTPLIVGPKEKAALADLRERAASSPVDVKWLMDAIKLPKVKAEHSRQMTAQSVDIPMGFWVTFSIETNHPCGTCRHMSMSSARSGRLPTPEALWMVAVELGFTGRIEDCVVYPEKLKQGDAINVIQPVAQAAGGNA